MARKFIRHEWNITIDGHIMGGSTAENPNAVKAMARRVAETFNYKRGQLEVILTGTSLRYRAAYTPNSRLEWRRVTVKEETIAKRPVSKKRRVAGPY